MRHINDLTRTETIYQKRLRTIRIKVRRSFRASDHFELLTVSQPASAHDLLRPIFASLDEDQEHLVLLVLNVSLDVIGYKLLASGAQDHVGVDCKVVFRNALLLGACSIILAHNHPSGNAEPSSHDVELTRKLITAGAALDIEVLDHIILARDRFISMKEKHPALFPEARISG